MTDKQVV